MQVKSEKGKDRKGEIEGGEQKREGIEKVKNRKGNINFGK